MPSRTKARPSPYGFLADQDVNELSRRGGDKRIASGERLRHGCARPLWHVLHVFARSEGGVAERVEEQRAEHLTRAEPGLLEALSRPLPGASHPG